MKLKLLTLLVTFGLLTFNVNAAEEKVNLKTGNPMADAMIQSAITDAEVAETACSMLAVARTFSKKIPECDACSAKTKTKTLDKVLACIAADEKVGLTDSFKQACDKGCGASLCKQGFLNPYGDRIAKACQRICCPIDATNAEVKKCMDVSKLQCK